MAKREVAEINHWKSFQNRKNKIVAERRQKPALNPRRGIKSNNLSGWEPGKSGQDWHEIAEELAPSEGRHPLWMHVNAHVQWKIMGEVSFPVFICLKSYHSDKYIVEK